jgi:hypothetical protein
MVHADVVKNSTSMGSIDLSLASSYAPAIICVGKLATMLAFSYLLGSVIWVGVIDRCLIFAICLYLDRSHHKEYIIDTNACVGIAFFSIVVNELRVIGHYSLPYWPYTYVFSVIWQLYSIVVLWFGELTIDKFVCGVLSYCIRNTHGVFRWVGETGLWSTEGNATAINGKICDKSYDKLSHVNHGNTKNRTDPFIPLLVTATLLYCECSVPIAMDVNYHIEVLVRVFCFASASLLWIYTMNVDEMHSHHRISFIPCINRFCVLLFSAPLILCIVVYIGMLSTMFYRGRQMFRLDHSDHIQTDCMYPETDLSDETGPLQSISGVLDNKVPEKRKQLGVLGTDGLHGTAGQGLNTPFDIEAAFAELVAQETDSKAGIGI